MAILTERPEIADRIQLEFGVNYDDGYLIITYGKDIYTKRGTLTEDLMIHEQTHIRQQGEAPAKWWDRYFASPAFRLDQEKEAYQNQYEYLKKTVKDKNTLYKMRMNIVKCLTGQMYGRIISQEEALKII
jgi:hypothetical protein